MNEQGNSAHICADAVPTTVNDLIAAYASDVDSPIHTKRICTRTHYGHLCKRIARDIGDLPIADVKARQILHWHEQFIQAGTIPMGHSVMGMLRILTGFGATILESPECVRLSNVLSKMRFKMGPPRTERLTADQVVVIRAEAHRVNRRSIALGQAFQFELMLRQKDVIGEWVPEDEPVDSDTFDLDHKWLRGIRWEEIDENLILTHTTSKRQKEIVVDLNLAPMVIQELMLAFGAVARNKMPESGPIIVAETNGLPWRAVEFRRNWRQIATAAGVPKTVRNMDTRSGAITEALHSGARPDAVRKAATHSQISMTTRYSRGDAEDTSEVMQSRVASRK